MAEIERLSIKPVECGCTLQFQPFTKGTRIVSCQGSKGATPPGVVSINPDRLVPCDGGKPYVVEAEQVTRYTARPVEGGDAA